MDDPHDSSVGLINGELAIPGVLLRREVFSPVVAQVCTERSHTGQTGMTHVDSQVLDLIEEQTKKVDQRIDALLLVGGFAGCEYLFRKVKVNVNMSI